MAPNLPAWKHRHIRRMIEQGCHTKRQIAGGNDCTIGAVKGIEQNLLRFGRTTAPGYRSGRPSSIPVEIRHALLTHLDGDPGATLQEMAQYLWQKFGVSSTKSSVSRALHSAGWSKKKPRRQAKEQDPDLIDSYLHEASFLHSWQCLFVDESGCDARDGFRRTAWSPQGVTPVQIDKFHRGERYQILPAYSQNGIVLSRIYRGTTDSAMFEDFIEQLLQHCGRFPEPNSVLIMDNASFHRSEKITQMCTAAGVKLLYLAPYSPRLNPIEEFFAELKAFIKKYWRVYEENPERGFVEFLQWCVDVVGRREKSAQGHFRHAGWTIEEPVEASV